MKLYVVSVEQFFAKYKRAFIEVKDYPLGVVNADATLSMHLVAYVDPNIILGVLCAKDSRTIENQEQPDHRLIHTMFIAANAPNKTGSSLLQCCLHLTKKNAPHIKTLTICIKDFHLHCKHMDGFALTSYHKKSTYYSRAIDPQPSDFFSDELLRVTTEPQLKTLRRGIPVFHEKKAVLDKRVAELQCFGLTSVQVVAICAELLDNLKLLHLWGLCVTSDLLDDACKKHFKCAAARIVLKDMKMPHRRTAYAFAEIVFDRHCTDSERLKQLVELVNESEIEIPERSQVNGLACCKWMEELEGRRRD